MPLPSFCFVGALYVAWVFFTWVYFLLEPFFTPYHRAFLFLIKATVTIATRVLLNHWPRVRVLDVLSPGEVAAVRGLLLHS